MSYGTLIMTDWKERARTLNNSLIAGDVPNAQQLLRSTKYRLLTRNETLHFAQFARRSGLPFLAIRALFPFVRPTKVQKPASDFELIEYANSLYRIGSAQESLKLLDQCRNPELPEVFFTRACIAVSEWNYVESVRNFKLFLEKSDSCSYDATIARTNLCAGLIFLERVDEAGNEIDRVIQICSEQNWR